MKADIPDAMVASRIDELVQDFEYRISQPGLTLADYLKYMGMNIEQFLSLIHIWASMPV